MRMELCVLTNLNLKEKTKHSIEWTRNKYKEINEVDEEEI